MSGQKNHGTYDPLILNQAYPDAEAIFLFQPESLKTALREGLVVIDTNVLLVPYSTGKDSLQQIRTTYTTLAADKRLIIPGQVAREFAKNRSEKLKTLYQQVSQKRNISIKRQTYPLLENVPEYQEVVRLESALDEHLGAYRKAVGNLLDAIGSWYWDDPVSSIYRELFSKGIVFEFAIDREELLTDLERRQVHRIPPGYKDAGKEDSGVGDLLIWKAITDLGRSRNKHVVFVSGDEKADWWHQSEGQALYPRFELIEEFRRLSGGRTFHIVSLSRLLAEFGASDAVVQEVRQEELNVNFEPATTRQAVIRAKEAAVERAVYKWLVRTYPGALIEANLTNSPVDFIVGTDKAAFAYDIKYTRHLHDAFLQLRRDGELRAPLYNLPFARKYLVIVTDVEEIVNGLPRLPARQSLRPGWDVIIGVLQENGEFLLVGSDEPPTYNEESGT